MAVKSRNLFLTEIRSKPFRGDRGKAKCCYKPVGSVFWEDYETVQIKPVEDKVREDVVDEIVKKRGVFSDERI